MLNKTPPKGMRDILPRQLAARNILISNIKKAYGDAGFSEIETPCVEDIRLLTSKEGGDNEKLLYRILKRGEKLEKAENELCDLGLRFDLTIPLARYYANNSGVLPPVFKAIQAGPVFRADRPQKGRYRQFVQCDIDIIGEDSYLAEVDLILATANALNNSGLKGFIVKINDRRLLSALLDYCSFESDIQEKTLITLDKLDKIGEEGVRGEILGFADQYRADKLINTVRRINSSASPLAECVSLFGSGVSTITDNLAHITDAVTFASDAKLVFDMTLVRGMNYYTGTIFEVYTDGISYALGGGGRYDKLIGKITGQEVPACGFSIGFERLAELVENNDVSQQTATAIIVPKEQLSQAAKIFAMAQSIRKDRTCSIYKKMKNFAYQLKSLAANGYSEFYLYDNGELKQMSNEK